MIEDIFTLMWKEWRELLRQRHDMRGGILRIATIVGVFGVLLPLQTGSAWVESPKLMALWVWVPLFLVTTVVADSFAGERERRTLETLLASRLSDRAILFGKICAAISYGVGLTLISILTGLVTINLASKTSGLILFSLTGFANILGFSLLGGGLAACAGVLVSLRAASVRQAQQTMSIAIIILIFVPVYGVQAMPEEWKATFAKLFMNADATQLIYVAMAALAIIDALLLVAAMARFKRAKLILD